MTTAPTSTQPASTQPASTQPASTQREPLTRARILRAALDYIDTHGLEALSMHKLGAALGVRGMSLYNHVTNKDDVLDGVVGLLWLEVAESAPPRAEWRDGYRSFAEAIRDAIYRHPKAGSLVVAQSVMPTPALRLVQSHIAAARDTGVPEAEAYALLRTVTSYALGSALNAVAWGNGQPGCQPSVSDLLRPDTPEELTGVAEIFCGQSDFDKQFEHGLDLMLRGT